MKKTSILQFIRMMLLLQVATFTLPNHALELIAHNSTEISSINKKHLKDLFMLRRSTWDNGTTVIIVALPDKHDTHVRFVKSMLGVFPYKVRRLWDRAIFAGMSRAPIQVNTMEEMIARVASTPGAIGYVNSETENDLVRTLSVVD